MFFPLIVVCKAAVPASAEACLPLNPPYFVATEERCIKEVYDTLNSPKMIEMTRNPNFEIKKIECIKVFEPTGTDS